VDKTAGGTDMDNKPIAHNSLLDRPLSRRSFLKYLAVTGGALCVGGTSLFSVANLANADADQTVSERYPETYCPVNCANGCHQKVTVRDGKIVRVEPAQFPEKKFNRTCFKGMAYAIQQVYGENRVKYPMRRIGERGSGEWEQITWDEATTIIADKFREISEQYGPDAIAFLHMTGREGGHWVNAPNRLMSLMGGSVVGHTGFMSDNAIAMACSATFGNAFPGNEHADMLNSELVIHWPDSAADSAMCDHHFKHDAKEKGVKFIAIDPRFSATAAACDWWIPIRPGTDTALAMGMIRYMLENDLWDRDFMHDYTVAPILVRSDNGALLRESDIMEGGSEDRYCIWDEEHSQVDFSDEEGVKAALYGEYVINGISARPSFQLLEDAAKEYTPEYVEKITGIPQADILKLSHMYATAKPAQVRGSQGMNRTYEGHQPIRALATLAALTGSIGKPGGGYVQASGYTMSSFLVNNNFANPDPDRQAASLKGTDLYSCITDSDPRPVKALWFAQYNMGVAAPNRNYFKDVVIPACDFVVVDEITMCDVTDFADIILPITTHFENLGGPLGAGWGNFYIKYCDQCIEPLWESKNELRAVEMIAQKLGFGEYFSKSEEEYHEEEYNAARSAYVKAVPYEELLEKRVLRLPAPDPYIVFEDLKFNTPTKRVQFYLEKLASVGQGLPIYMPPYEGQDSPKTVQYPLSMVGDHHRTSGHSMHHNIPWVKEIDAGPRLEINPIDAEPRGIQNGDVVTCYNDRGHATMHAKITEGIMPGTVSCHQGYWVEQYISGHYSELTSWVKNPAQQILGDTNWNPYDILVEVRKGA